MAGERVERRLAAILAVDVAGYSRLMDADEEGTLAVMLAVRRELGDPKIKEDRGRIVKTTGDGLLVEFASVVDAVRCAVEVQPEMIARNTDVPAERRLEFRMGINVGDKMATSSATASTSPPVWKRWPNRAGSASVLRPTSRCGTGLIFPLTIWASSWSRTSRDRCAFTALDRGPRARRARPRWSRGLLRRCRCLKGPRSRFCRSRTGAATRSRNTSSTASSMQTWTNSQPMPRCG
jgi:hypothetical protein